MIVGLSTISLLLGTAIAYMASRYPKRRAIMETVGGVLLIGGLGFMGCALEPLWGRRPSEVTDPQIPRIVPVATR
jgi:hypothetical protein